VKPQAKAQRGLKFYCPLKVRHKLIWEPWAFNPDYVVSVCKKCGVRSVCKSVTLRLSKKRKVKP
jgi:hypothetical protein